MRLLTFGHGTLDEEELAALIRQSGVERVVDVRTTPKSRRHPWVWREAMQAWAPRRAGAAYEWAADLGGRRRPLRDSVNVALRHPNFRGYADYMRTEPFLRAFDALCSSLDDAVTAIMCSETLWWRCHRRLISDAAVVLRGVDVLHLDARGNLREHVLTSGVRQDGGLLCYDMMEAA